MFRKFHTLKSAKGVYKRNEMFRIGRTIYQVVFTLGNFTLVKEISRSW